MLDDIDGPYFSLAPLGFGDWEHTDARRSMDGTWTLYIRPIGYNLPFLLIVQPGGSTLNAIDQLISTQRKWGSHFRRLQDQIEAAAAAAEDA